MKSGSHPHFHTRKDGSLVSVSLHLPMAMARAIPDTSTFVAEFVDEGILYRFAGHRERGGRDVEASKSPKWAQDGDGA